MELVRPYLGFGNSYIYNYVSDGISLTDWQRLLGAAKVATQSTHRFPLGSVVYKSRKPLASAFNNRKSSPHMFPYRESIHSEMCVLGKLADPSGTTVYTVRLDKKQRFMPAKPCLYCLEKMKQMGVSRVVFSLDERTADSFHIGMITSEFIKEERD